MTGDRGKGKVIVIIKEHADNNVGVDGVLRLDAKRADPSRPLSPWWTPVTIGGSQLPRQCLSNISGGPGKFAGASASSRPL